MKLAKFALTPTVVAISAAMFVARGAVAEPIEVSDDPATNVANIQGAINADGATVVELGEGVFDLNATITLEKGVTLKGQGFEKTVLRQNQPAKGTKLRVIVVNHAEARLEGVTLTGGDLPANFEEGGGVRIGPEGGTVAYCMISNNVNSASSNGYGAGVGLRNGLLTHSYVINNNAKSGSGGGVGAYQNDAAFTIDTCLIADNTGYGLAKYRGQGMTVKNTTIAGNSNFGVYANQPGTVKFANCIIAGNKGTTGTYLPNFGGNADVNTETAINGCDKYSLIGDEGGQKLSAKAVAKQGNPLFKDADNGDYHLKNGSAAIGLGLWYEGIPNDLDGLERADPPEAGCYQYVQDTVFSVTADFAPKACFIDQDVTFTATPDAVPAGAELVYTWTLHRVDAAADDIVFTGIEAVRKVPAGEWSVTVKAVSSSSVPAEAESTASVNLMTGVRKMYVTSRPNAKAAYPYDTPETAATNVCDAATHALGEATIELDAGEHVASGTVVMEKDVTLFGQGMDATTVRCGAANTRTFLLNSKGAVVSNLTVVGGVLDGTGHQHGAGVKVDAAGGTVTRCRITGAQLKYVNCFGAGVYLATEAGRLIDSIVENCTNDVDRASAVNCESTGTIRGCLIRNNYAGVGCTLYLDGNPTLENCTIVDNVMAGTSSNAVVAVLPNRPRLVANNIFARNRAPNSTIEPSDRIGVPNWYLRVAPLMNEYVKNNCWEGSVGFGTGCLFTSGILDAATGGYHIERNSPCVNAGVVNTSWMTGATDLDGKPRLHRGKVDLGCCQADLPGFLLLLR